MQTKQEPVGSLHFLNFTVLITYRLEFIK